MKLLVLMLMVMVMIMLMVMVMIYSFEGYYDGAACYEVDGDGYDLLL
jgi:hypothetical protein